MKTQNKQILKRFTYLCLALSSISFSSAIQAMDRHFEDEANYPVKGGYIPIPRLGKSIADDLEGPNLAGPNSKVFKRSKDKIQRDIKSPPRLPMGKTCSKSQSYKPGLATQAEQFYISTQLLKKKMEDEDKKVSDLGKKIADGVDAIAEATIEKAVKSKKAKNTFMQFKDWARKKLKNLFN